MASKKSQKRQHLPVLIGAGISVVFLAMVIYLFNSTDLFSTTYNVAAQDVQAIKVVVAPKRVLDFADYDLRMLRLATASSTIALPIPIVSTTATSTASTTLAATTTIKKVPLWPVKAPYPNVDAILPFNRIVAYYGNFLSTGMGVLGQYPAPEMLTRLKAEVAKWQAADPTTPVIPAIDYIAVTAQGSPGADGLYRARMPDSEIDHAIDLAAQVHGIVFLEIQAGLSTVYSEVPALEKYLKMPQVHLALDPEFYMRNGNRPGIYMGSMDATEINWAANYLADLVRTNNLPPKILVVHRFTYNMLTNYQNIKPLPEVQIVVDMDGWGSPAKKNTTYTKIVAPEPVQFTGFKLFYKNDLQPPSSGMMTPEQILNLKPRPIFIQYQ